MATHHKLLLVDPNTGALAALRETLSFASDLEVVGDAGLGPAALTWARTLQPDIVIVAVDEPVGRPLATIQLLAQGSPTWTVLGLAPSVDHALFRKTVLAGATDVEGIFTADPRVVPTARKVAEIGYEEMLELAQLGARVMHPRAVELGELYDMPILVASSFSDVPGTSV